MRLSIYASPIRLEASAAKFRTILTRHQTRGYNSIAKKQFTGLGSRIRGIVQFTACAVNRRILSDRTGLAQGPSEVTRFRLTFSKPGIYPYICSLHDVLRMKTSVVVLP
jgi:plastocyanin